MKLAFGKLSETAAMENAFRFSDLREKFRRASVRPKRLRFFSELGEEAQEFAVSEEKNRADRFDWDNAEFLTEDFKTQLADYGFSDLEVY